MASTSGAHRGCLTGPGTANFNLELYKRSGFFATWSRVARSAGSTSTESITYNGTAGTYQWRVASAKGSGAYAFGTTHP